ncbi:hypothetical protein [Alteromonas gracilis]|uniref:hypothetical protein n=1 Tax=Alteromonas gracilis TaxID=1479524 RepID=UPI0030D00B92
MYRIINYLAFIGCIIWIFLDQSPEPVVVLLLTVAGFFRDDIHGVIGKNVFTLTPKNQLIRDLESARYSFISPEFINPQILNDLSGWLSDTGDQIVSINISESNDSNRYYGDVTSEETDGYPIVTSSAEEGWVSYKYIGNSFSGVHIVQTWSNGGGSGVYTKILLVTLSSDSTLESNGVSYSKKPRYVIKLVGSLPLGDRYQGQVKYRFGILSISPCEGMKSLRESGSRILVI